MSQDSHQLVMIRPTLDDLPDNSLPDGYYLCHYTDKNDSVAWEKIISEAFQWDLDFDQNMIRDDAFRPERIWFVCYGNIPISTASAWYKSQWDKSVGYLHMVGTLPAYAGKGLGFQVSLAALHQMKREGRKSVVLETDDFRVPAIKTYIKLGFVPKIMHKTHEIRWKDILEKVEKKKL